ncbi:hypothetical protein L873DRAFT_712941 [Choiromyces venosus 120613-1]|uniref:Uncharacterized protein n=1 Tax=Choiromyces venosus 120613-1 TaxID=1336337 RepID=A0A3N4JRX1_9PEZI|nr:hypothetical protein L873DRAFT_712941 [Choiromyces venosus 120613-1]
MSPHWQTIILPCFLEFAEKEGTVPGDLHILLQQYYPVLFLFARDHLSISEGLGNEESIDWFVKARLAEIENIVCQTKAIFMPTLSDCSPNPSPTSDARQQLCGSNTELDQDSYSAKGSTHLISTKDQSLVMEMVDAMEDDSDTYDSESVLPYRKWRNMTRENYYDLALRITEKIDKMHNNEHDICQGLSRQKRIESLLVLMKNLAILGQTTLLT